MRDVFKHTIAGILLVLMFTATLLVAANFLEQHLQKQQTVQLEPTPEQLKEKQCYLEAIWYEARGEGYEGMYRVAEVIQNRKESGKYPSSACAVITQPQQFSYRNGYHYETKLKVKYNYSEQEVFDQAHEIAEKASEGRLTRTMPDTVMWYTTHKIKRVWMKGLALHTKVGNHKFFMQSS